MSRLLGKQATKNQPDGHQLPKEKFLSSRENAEKVRVRRYKTHQKI